MLGTTLIFAVALPALIAATVLVLATRPWARRREDDEDDAGVRWAAALAIGAGYIAGQIGLDGGPTAGDPTERVVFYVALVAVAIGAGEGLLADRLGAVARWSLRALAALGLGAAVVAPLWRAGTLNSGAAVSWIAAVGAATLLVLAALDRALADEPGAAPALGVVLVGTLGAAAVVLGKLLTSARIAGALVAAAGGAMVVAWRLPARGRLRSAAPALAAGLVAPWAIAALYGELPKASLALLALAPAALLVARLRKLASTRALATALRLALAVVVAASGAGLAAARYFGVGDGGGASAASAPASSAATAPSGSAAGKAAGTAAGKGSGGGSVGEDDYGYE